MANKQFGLTVLFVLSLAVATTTLSPAVTHAGCGGPKPCTTPEPRPIYPPSRQLKGCQPPAGHVLYLYSTDPDEGYTLYLMKGNGTDARQITSQYVYAPTWSSDGKQILFESNLEGGGQLNLYTMNKFGKNINKVADKGIDGAWSPDGQKIAFFDLNYDKNYQISLSVMDADGSDKQQLEPLPTDGGSVEWSPDGSQVVVIQRTGSTSSVSYAIVLIDIASGDIRQVATPSFPDSIKWSPDGKRIAFTDATKNNHRDIFVMNSDGSDLRQLTDDGDNYSDLAWSADSKSIAFSTSSSVWIVEVDSGDEKRLTSDDFGDVSATTWSPDGKYLLFAAATYDNNSIRWARDLYTVKADGTGLCNLTRGGGDHAAPSWEPN